MSDPRPLAATGHLSLRARGARAAAERLVAVGVRAIVINDRFAVLELRGGTHIVVHESQHSGIVDAPFDLMFDDLDAARARFGEEGFEVTPVRRGGIHRSFVALSPDGYRIQVLDSHVGGRLV